MGKGMLVAKGLAARLFLGRPDPATWVFSSKDNREFNYNSRYLFEYVRNHLPQVKPLYVINDDRMRRNLEQIYGEGYFIETKTLAGMRRALRGSVWFTSAGLPVYGPYLRKKRVIVNLWHGIPLKKIALRDPHMGQGQKTWFRKIFSENYTYILTSSSHLVDIMAESFGVEKDIIKIWGQPRNDTLFGSEIGREEIFKAGGIKDDPSLKKKIRFLLLYAPTFREEEKVRYFPFPDYDKDRLEAFLEEQEILLFLHPHLRDRQALTPYLTSHVRLLERGAMEDVMDILGAFDLLVTDYSSIYIDYLLTGRPILFLPYDLDSYLERRGMNFPYEEVTPGPKPCTMEEFLQEIRLALQGEDCWGEKRREMRDYFHEVKEPCSARICEEILQIDGTVR